MRKRVKLIPILPPRYISYNYLLFSSPNSPKKKHFIHQHFSTHPLNHQSAQSIQNPNHKKKTLRTFITLYHYSYSTNSTFPLLRKNRATMAKRERKKTKTKKKNKNKTSYPRTKFIHNRALVRVIPNISCAGRAALSLGKTENEEEAGGGRRSRVVIPEYEISTEGTRVCPWP